MSLEHKIIWNELNCGDVDASAAFYGALFGWTIREEDRDTYLHFYMNDVTVAGLVSAPEGAPHGWQIYVGTEDAGAMGERALAAGGSAITPVMDIPHTGKIQILADPEGASFGAFQPNDTDRDTWNASSTPGHFCWVELVCDNVRGQVDFYQTVVGWTTQTMDMGGMDYTLLQTPEGGQENSVGGVMAKQAPGPSMWLPYVTVASVDESTAKAAELGATVVMPPMNVGEFGRCSMFVDPTGVLIAIYEVTGDASC